MSLTDAELARMRAKAARRMEYQIRLAAPGGDR